MAREPWIDRSPTRFVHRLSTPKKAGRRAYGRFDGRASSAPRERKKTKDHGQVEVWRLLLGSRPFAPCAGHFFAAPEPPQEQPVDSWCASPQRTIAFRGEPAVGSWSFGPKRSLRLREFPPLCQAKDGGYLSEFACSFGFFCPHVTGLARYPYITWSPIERAPGRSREDGSRRRPAACFADRDGWRARAPAGRRTTRPWIRARG